MPSTSIICGILLVLIGVVGYAYGLSTEHASITALIPAVFGIVLAILGWLANEKENLRKHLMHAAVLIALLGFILPVGRLASKFSELSLSAAVLSQAAMAFVCLIFVVLAVQSFVAARRG
jgi:lysylphosphatidylglycerol synthetase-like protein (DUF2156 family)